MLTSKVLKYISDNFKYNKDTGIVERFDLGVGVNRFGYLSKSSKHRSYVRFSVCNKSLYAHRIAYFLIKNEMPLGEIDHIDGNGMNNKWSNIRVVTHSGNAKNQKKNERNKSGVTGVHWDSVNNKWYAQITVDNKPVFLGRHKEKRLAELSRIKAEKKYGFHGNHGARDES